jgi:hypothetical protein
MKIVEFDTPPTIIMMLIHTVKRKYIILKASFISAWGADLLQIEVSFTVFDAIWLAGFLCEASENILINSFQINK